MNRSHPHPAFDEPWQAQLFALTVALSEAGHFSWPDWTATFAATLKMHGKSRDLDGGNDYYHAWLDAFATLLQRLDFATPQETASIQALWQNAYLTTPHGHPVRLPI